MRVGFLFNHYLDYQVIHAAPIAFELSRLEPGIDVQLLFSSSSALTSAKQLEKLYPEHNASFSTLERVGPLLSGITALQRPMTLWKNRKLLSSFDALVAPEKNYIILKALRSFRRVCFVGLRHGAGDRPVVFNKGPLKFDGLLVPGQSYFKRFAHELPPGRCKIIGYPKFEVLEKLNPEVPTLFENSKPVVLYTPHFHRTQSSWLKLGEKVLSFFAESTDYNLIFAPHARLFSQARYHGDIDTRPYEKCSNILIDTGSERSFDMSYTRAADIYLGDVSSQVYEYVYHRPRPCIFLNANGINAASMKFWTMGEVIDDIASLAVTLVRLTER